MPSYVTPKKNTEYIFYVGLTSQANTKIFQANPTLAAGDAKVSTDGGALANLTTLPAVTPASGKMVKVTLSAGEMNGDNVTVVFSDAAGDEWCDLVINIQATARQIDDLAFPTTSGRSIDVSATGEVEANVTQIDAAATSGNNATLNLKQLNIVNNAGSALVASSTGSNGHGIEASGNGSGDGLRSTGGASSAHGINAIGGVTNGDGVRFTGTGAGSAIQATGGTTGHGIQAVGGQTSGNGIRARVNAVGASNDNGMSIEGNGSGNGLRVIGGATGHGFQATGGATSGNAINAAATAGNGHGLNVAGQGSGHGINTTGGATGNGIDANGGATSGDGINAAAPTLGDGMQLTGAGGGYDLNATLTNSLEVTTTDITIPALANFFTVDSGETYGTSVAGSVVQEITANSGGAGITPQDVRDAMKLAPTAGAAAAGSVDAKLDDILDDTGTSGVVISTATQNSIADSLLKRDWTAITGEAARSALNALRAIRNRVRINAGTMTVYEEDDATPAWTAPVTTDAAALPIIEIDPT